MGDYYNHKYRYSNDYNLLNNNEQTDFFAGYSKRLNRYTSFNTPRDSINTPLETGNFNYYTSHTHNKTNLDSVRSPNKNYVSYKRINTISYPNLPSSPDDTKFSYSTNNKNQ